MPVPIQTHDAFGLKYGPSPLVQFVRCIESSTLRWRIVRGGTDPLWAHEPAAMIEIIEISDATLTDNDVEPPRQETLDDYSYVTDDGRRLFKPTPYNDCHFQQVSHSRAPGIRGTRLNEAEGTDHIKGQSGARSSWWSPHVEWNMIQSFANICEWDLWKDFDGPHEDYAPDRIVHEFLKPEEGFEISGVYEITPTELQRSQETKERYLDNLRDDLAEGRLGNYQKLFDAVTEMVRMGPRYVPGSIDVAALMNARGREEARMYLLESESEEVKDMAEQAKMKANTLTKRKQRALDSARTIVQIGPEALGANILAKLTQTQVDYINEHGGVIALRWTGGKHVALQPFPQLPEGLILRNSGKTLDGWQDWMLAPGETKHKGHNLIDVVCDIARRHDVYAAYKANLPRGKRPSRDAWKTDLRALAIAKRRWSNVAVFNFGAPGWLTRYKSWTPEEQGAFDLSGYSPKPLES